MFQCVELKHRPTEKIWIQTPTLCPQLHSTKRQRGKSMLDIGRRTKLSQQQDQGLLCQRWTALTALSKVLLFFESPWNIAMGHLHLSLSSQSWQTEMLFWKQSSRCQLKQAQTPCLVDQNPAWPAYRANYETISAHLSLQNDFELFLYSCGQRIWLHSFSKLILSAMATTFNLKLWQPIISRIATSLKAAKAEKCENNLHMLSPLLAGRGSKIAVALSQELKMKKRLSAESGWTEEQRKATWVRIKSALVFNHSGVGKNRGASSRASYE